MYVPARSEHVLAVLYILNVSNTSQSLEEAKALRALVERGVSISAYIEYIELGAIEEDLRDIVIYPIEVDLAWTS